MNFNSKHNADFSDLSSTKTQERPKPQLKKIKKVKKIRIVAESSDLSKATTPEVLKPRLIHDFHDFDSLNSTTQEQPKWKTLVKVKKVRKYEKNNVPKKGSDYMDSQSHWKKVKTIRPKSRILHDFVGGWDQHIDTSTSTKPPTTHHNVNTISKSSVKGWKKVNNDGEMDHWENAKKGFNGFF